MWKIRWLINELDAVVIQKSSQNWLNKETVVKPAIIHQGTITALKEDTSVRPLNFNSILKSEATQIHWMGRPECCSSLRQKVSGAS